MDIIQTIKVDDFKIESRENNSLFIDGYVGCYSEYEGCTSMEHIRGIIKVNVEDHRITQILSEDLKHVSSEYDGVDWEDIIIELEDTLRTCFKVVLY